MANNRMYLRCRHCGETFFLGKVYSEYFTDDVYYKHGLTHALNKFYEEHAFCDKEPVEGYTKPTFKPCEPHYENQYEIAYEFAEEGEFDESERENNQLHENER